jgi:EamA domain-containing membrane protein RarD
VSALFGLWLLLIFGPMAITVAVKLSFWWHLGAMGWIALAICGSAWGLYRVVRKRKAATLAVMENTDRAALDGLPTC